jgi:hypothetical protein
LRTDCGGYYLKPEKSQVIHARIDIYVLTRLMPL